MPPKTTKKKRARKRKKKASPNGRAPKAPPYINPALAPTVRSIEGLHEDPRNARLHPSGAPLPDFGDDTLAFRAPDDSGGPYRTVHLVNADGSGDVTNLAWRAGDISWSPSGDRIAVAHGSQSVKIYHLALDTGGTIYVAATDRYDVAAVGTKVTELGWAKTLDDSLALKVYDPDLGNSDIWIIDLGDGVFDPDAGPPGVDVFLVAQHVNLTPTPRGYEGYPSWAPDDSRILYGLSVSLGSTEGFYTVAVDGNEDPERITGKKVRAFWPDWRR